MIKQAMFLNRALFEDEENDREEGRGEDGEGRLTVVLSMTLVTMHW